ncbi:MAG: YitT family protein [Clostridia bacterium]|nr:YitT family protein [Clostridia bacterium]MBQ8368924.1 YitT family protein [Clostridia bacterium]MBQ8513173.1 YitT family protein [Clostridia bacterium]
MKKTMKQNLKSFFLVVAGTLVLALGTAVFIIPFDLVAGGISSMAILLDKVIAAEFVTTDLLITVITWSLFFLGLISLGRGFALKTLVSTIVYPIGISLFSRLLDPGVFGGIFDLSRSAYSEIAILLAALFGGVLIGAGCALTFLGGGSTGGVDILAFLICKFVKGLRSSVVIFVIDAATVLLGLFVIGDLVISLLGVSSAFISAAVIDKLFLGESKAFIAQIVSDRYDEINRAVAGELERTTSIFDMQGGYSGEHKKMLMVSFTMEQYNDLMGIIARLDSGAFITVHRAHEINGEGWTR